MERIARFLFEVGHLKRVARSGWWVAGVRDPESVAEHSFRCSWVGYLLALSEGADPARVVLMCLAHDLQEARINDHHKVSQAYMNTKAVETKVFRDQVAGLPGEDDLRRLRGEFQTGESLEARVARDADRLECAFQAREYINEGHEPCRRWIESTRPVLRTESGKALFEVLASSDPNDWYRDLPRVP